jgi:hypothetical protein
MGEEITLLLPAGPKGSPRCENLLAPRILANAVLAAGLAAIASSVLRVYPPPIGPREEGVAGLTEVVRPQGVVVGIVGAHAAEVGGSLAEPTIRAVRREGRFPSVVEREGPDFSE